MQPSGGVEPSYVERLTPPAGLWVGGWALALALGISFYAALGPVAGLVAMLVPGVAFTALLQTTTPVIVVGGGEVAAGRARIPVTALGPARALDTEEARLVRGPGSDPEGYHLIRGWLPRGVLIPVVDPADPTPYWFLASRQPEELAAAIDAAQRAD